MAFRRCQGMKMTHRRAAEVAETLEFRKSLLKLSRQGRKDREPDAGPAAAAARQAAMARAVEHPAAARRI